MPPRNRASARKRRWLVPVLIAIGLLLVVASGGFLFAANLEQHDDFCASCHSQPESTYFERSQAANSVDLASKHRDKSVSCIDCHAGPGLIGRISAMSIGAGDLFAWISGRSRQPAPLTVPIGDVNCLKCHADTLTTQSFDRHFHALLPKWQAIDNRAATCVGCHSAHTTDGQPQLTFLQVARAQSVCERCHAVAGG